MKAASWSNLKIFKIRSQAFPKCLPILYLESLLQNSFFFKISVNFKWVQEAIFLFIIQTSPLWTKRNKVKKY